MGFWTHLIILVGRHWALHCVCAILCLHLNNRHSCQVSIHPITGVGDFCDISESKCIFFVMHGTHDSLPRASLLHMYVYISDFFSCGRFMCALLQESSYTIGRHMLECGDCRPSFLCRPFSYHLLKVICVDVDTAGIHWAITVSMSSWILWPRSTR